MALYRRHLSGLVTSPGQYTLPPPVVPPPDPGIGSFPVPGDLAPFLPTLEALVAAVMEDRAFLADSLEAGEPSSLIASIRSTLDSDLSAVTLYVENVVAAVADQRGGPVDLQRSIVKSELALCVPDLMPMPSHFWPMVYADWQQKQIELAAALGSASVTPVVVVPPEPEAVDTVVDTGAIAPVESGVDLLGDLPGLSDIKAKIDGLSTSQVVVLGGLIGVGFVIVSDMFRRAPHRPRRKRNPCHARG